MRKPQKPEPGFRRYKGWTYSISAIKGGRHKGSSVNVIKAMRLPNVLERTIRDYINWISDHVFAAITSPKS